MKLDFDDLLIVPKAETNINTRSLIMPYYGNKLPLFTAPMDTVISNDNARLFDNHQFNVCLPRDANNKIGFNSYSLAKINDLLQSGRLERGYYLIDIANGHIDYLHELIRRLKESNPFITLMVGNVANPATYQILSDAGADYIRVGIGNGNGCLTTQQTGIGYPMASLISECYDISKTLKNPAYIIADGGMKDYSDIIKALALGADYVMIGSILNKALESAGDNYLWKQIKISQDTANLFYKLHIPIYKKFRGMSTKDVQRKWNASVIKTSEGINKFNKVEYTISQWVKNFEHYLRSAMSYAGARDLSEFIGKVELVQISNNAYKRFNK